MKTPVRFASRLTTWVLAFAVAASGIACLSSARHARAQSTEANITRLTTSILARSQFAHHPLDHELAGKFLNSYLDSLDGTHSLFLASDVKEFTEKRDELALGMLTSGNSALAQTIWQRYLQRLTERRDFVKGLLQKGPFKFTGDETYAFDREHAPRPKDLKEAHALWRDRLRAEYLEEKLADSPPNKIAATLKKRYEQQLRGMQALNKREVLDVVLNALTRVYDPHSEYLDHEQMESLAMSMNLSLFGIGATLETEDGYTRIRNLLPGGPASKSPLKPGDRIIAVAQAGKDAVDIVNMPLTRAVQLIRGPKGTKVTLTILPAGAAESAGPTEVAIVRDEIQLEDQEAKASLLEVPTQDGKVRKLGVIDLPSFYAGMDEHDGKEPRSVTDDVARLLKKLKAEKVDGIVLDLRHNGGGSLDEAISLTGLFIPKGPVVLTRGPEGDLDVGTDPDPSTLYGGPLVVLTSRFSASASEILAGALQDYGRALIVGDSTTYGKGTVQSILPLSRIMDQNDLHYTYDPGALKITVQKFYRPSGASTQLRGVASDIVLPSTTDVSDISESAQDNALPWDTVPAAPFAHQDKVKSHLEALRARSAERVAANPRFGYMQEDIVRLRQKLSEQSVSLNEALRRKQLASDKARKEEREAWLKAHLEADYARVDIRLKDLVSGPRKTAKKPEGAPAVAVSAQAKSAGQADADEASSQAEQGDPVLQEAVHILGDYVSLLREGSKKSEKPQKTARGS